jgi:hypothetical protein
MHTMKTPTLMIVTLLGAATCLFSGCEEKPKSIAGKATLSIELQKTLKPTAVLYLIARRPGENAGPPLAVKRFPQPILFPVDFNLSAQDAMIPDTPFEGKIMVTARIAQSGSATPVSPGDIEGHSPAPIEAGSKDIVISLDQVRP